MLAEGQNDVSVQVIHLSAQRYSYLLFIKANKFSHKDLSVWWSTHSKVCFDFLQELPLLRWCEELEDYQLIEVGISYKVDLLPGGGVFAEPFHYLVPTIDRRRCADLSTFIIVLFLLRRLFELLGNSWVSYGHSRVVEGWDFVFLLKEWEGWGGLLRWDLVVLVVRCDLILRLHS